MSLIILTAKNSSDGNDYLAIMGILIAILVPIGSSIAIIIANKIMSSANIKSTAEISKLERWKYRTQIKRTSSVELIAAVLRDYSAHIMNTHGLLYSKDKSRSHEDLSIDRTIEMTREYNQNLALAKIDLPKSEEVLVKYYRVARILNRVKRECMGSQEELIEMSEIPGVGTDIVNEARRRNRTKSRQVMRMQRILNQLKTEAVDVMSRECYEYVHADEPPHPASECAHVPGRPYMKPYPIRSTLA